MTDISLEVKAPGMPNTAMCINSDCRVMFFNDGLVCPACTQTAKYKVVDMKYYVQKTGF